MKWYGRKQREFAEQVAIDIFGSKVAMKEHFRRCRARYNGYLCYLQANNILGSHAHEEFNSLPPEEKAAWRRIAQKKNEEMGWESASP